METSDSVILHRPDPPAQPETAQCPGCGQASFLPEAGLCVPCQERAAFEAATGRADAGEAR